MDGDFRVNFYRSSVTLKVTEKVTEKFTEREMLLKEKAQTETEFGS